MAVRRFIVDSGGTSRFILRRIIVDSGGVSRVIKRRFVIDSGGTARLTFVGEPTISLDATYTADDSVSSPASATCSFRLTNAGLIQSLNTGGTTELGAWISDTSLAGNYEVRATLVSGTLSGGTVGSYEVLSSTRTWFVTRSGSGSKECTFTVEIRKTGTGTVLDSSNVTITAAVDA